MIMMFWMIMNTFFIKCKNICTVWQVINNMVSQKYDCNIKLTCDQILTGVHCMQKHRNYFINNIISVGKNTISKFKYGKYPNVEHLLETELKLRKMLM